MDRNELIQQWRQRNPDAWALPDSTAFYSAVQELRDQGQMPEDEAIKNEYQDIRTEDAPGLITEGKNAFKAGVDQAQAKLYGLTEMAADATGLDSVSNWAKEHRQSNEQEAAEEWKPTIASVDDIRTPKELAYWLTGIAGNQTPVLAPTIAAGVATSGASLPVSLAAPAALGFAQSQNYGELKDAGGENAMPLSVANGLIGAAINAVGPFRSARKAAQAAAAAENTARSAGMSAEQIEKAGLEGASKVTASFIDQVPNPLMRVALAAAHEGNNNMLLGIAQEASTLATEAISQRNNPDFDIPIDQIRKRLSESAITGFVSGAGLGGAYQAFKNRGMASAKAEGAATPTPEGQAAGAYDPLSKLTSRAAPTGVAPTDMSIEPSIEAPVAKSPTVANTPPPTQAVSTSVANTPPPSVPVRPAVPAPTPLVQEPAGGAGSAPHVNSGSETAPAPAPIAKMAPVKIAEQPIEQPAVAAPPTLTEIRAKAQELRNAQPEAGDVMTAMPKISKVAEPPKVEAPAAPAVIEPPKIETPAPMPVPAPQAPVVEQTPELPNTRGRGVAYHGASKEFNLSGDGHLSSEKNIIGGGLYTTDALDIAKSYQKKNKVADFNPVVYRIEETSPVKFYDLNQPIDPEFRSHIEQARSDSTGLLDQALENLEKRKPQFTLNDLMTEMRDWSASYEVPAYDVQDQFFTYFQQYLEKKGYGGFEDVGGNRAGRGKVEPHKVKVYWNPDTQVRLVKVEPGEDVLSHPESTYVDSTPSEAQTSAQPKATETALSAAPTPDPLPGNMLVAHEPGDVSLSHALERNRQTTGDGKREPSTVTRTAAFFVDKDGKMVAVPITRGSDGFVRFEVRPKEWTRPGLLKSIGELAFSRMSPEDQAKIKGGKLSTSLLTAILDEGRTASTEGTQRRYEIIRKAGADAGWFGDRKFSKKSLSAEDFEAEYGLGRHVSVGQFKDPLKPGVYKMGLKPEEFAAILPRLKETAGEHWIEGYGKPRLVKEVVGGDSQMAAEAMGNEGSSEMHKAIPERSEMSLAPKATEALKEVERIKAQFDPSSAIEPPKTETPKPVLASVKPVQSEAPSFFRLSKEAVEDLGEGGNGMTSRVLRDLKALPDQKLVDVYADRHWESLTPEQQKAFDNLSDPQKAAAIRMGLAQVEEYGRTGVARRLVPAADHLATGDSINGVTVPGLMRELAARGIDAAILGKNGVSAHAIFRSEGGATSIDPSNRTAALVLDNVLNPTESGVLSTLHEILHDQIKQMPEWLQDVLHDTVARIPDGDLAFYSRKEADPRLTNGSISGHTLTDERLVEHLTFHGIEADTARNMVGTFWRAVKEHFYRAALWLQKQLLGEENVGGKLAMDYAENLAKQIASGDMSRLKSFADRFNINVSYGRIARLVTKDNTTYVEMINPRTGRVEYPTSTTLDHASVEYSIESKFAAAKEQLFNSGLLERYQAEELLAQALGNPEDVVRHESPTLDTIRQEIAYRVQDAVETAERIAAKCNHLGNTYRKLFEAAKVEHPEWTFEYFMDQHGRLPDLDAVKEKALKTFEVRIEDELGEKDGRKFVNAEAKIDELPENRRGIAENEMLAEIRSHADKIADQIKVNQAAKVRIEEKEQLIRAKVAAIDANLHDMKSTESFAKQVLREGLTQLARSLDTVQESEYSRGFEEGVLRGLEKEASRDELRQRYTDRLIQRIDVNGMSLISTLKGLFDMEQRVAGVDFEAMSPAEIREAVLREVQKNTPESSDLKHLVRIGEGPDAQAKGTALLTAVITLLKKHAHLTEVIRAQLDKSTNSAESLRQLHEVLNETNETKLRQMRDTITQDLKRPGARMIQKWLNVRDESLAQLKELDRINELDNTLNRSKNTLLKMQGALEYRRGVSHDFTFAPGAQLLVPSSPDEPSTQLQKASVPLDMSKDHFLKSQEVREWLHKQDAWLDYNADKPRDAVYFTVKEMNRQLKLAIGSDKPNETINNMRTGMFYGVGEMLRNTGTQMGALAERMITKMVGIHQALRVEGFALAKKWERAEENLSSRIGRSVADTRSLFFREMCYFMGRRAELPVEEAMPAFEAYITKDPEISSLLRKPGAAAALREYTRLSFANNEYFIRNSVKEGNKVADEKLRAVNVQTGAEATQLRNPLERGVTGGTFRQRLSDSIRSLMTTTANRKILLGDGPANPFKDVDLKLRLNSEEYRKSLNDFFTPDLKSGFLAPLLLNEHGTSLHAPKRADGIEAPCAYRHVVEAWKNSGGDLLEFSKKLYEASGKSTVESETEYSSRVISWVSKVLFKLESEVNPKENVGGASLGHFAMDSRVSADYPKQWVDYVPFTTHDNEASAHLIAANASFGRNLSNLKETVNAVRKELGRYASELGATIAEREKIREAHKNDKGWITKRENAELLAKKLEQFDRRFENLLDPIRGVTGDDAGPIREAFNLVVSGMISGPKSALSNLLSPADTLGVERSISAKSAQTVGRSYLAATKYVANSFARMFGANLLANDTNANRIARSGGLDVANQGLTLRDYWAGYKGRGTLSDMTFRGRTQSVLRAFRDVVMNTSIGKKDGVGPAFRLHLFQYTQQLSNFSVVDGLLSRLDDIVRDASRVYEAHPEKIGETLTAKDLGYSDARGFDSFKEEAILHGISIEDLAKRASDRIKKGQDILDDDSIRGITNMALGRVVGESSIASRPLYMQETALGKTASALTGWSFFKTGQVLRTLRDPNGRRDVLSLLNGAKVIALGMVPAAVAFSYMLDQYDEKLAKKKSNLKGLDEGNFFEALLERTVAVGTFGIAGNLMDTAVNVKDGSGNKLLSADQRVVFLNSLLGLTKTIADLNAMGGFENANYANFYRRVMQSVGMGGALQYIQIANNMLGNPDIPLFKDEASVTARINVGNLLRAAGREQGFEVKQMGGASTPNALTPYVTNMALAAYSNDPQAFIENYKKAVEIAKNVLNKENPQQAVAESFASRNPLKNLFQTPLTTQEYRKLLMTMPAEAQAAVQQALAHFNQFGSRIGAKPYVGSTKAEPRMVQMMREKRLESSWEF